MLITATTDVLVIGAGLSGIQAAVDLQKAGLSYLVLEATDRIGGKVFTVPAIDTASSSSPSSRSECDKSESRSGSGSKSKSGSETETSSGNAHARTGKFVDLGPAWINNTSQSRMWAIGKKYGVQFQKQIQGDQVFELKSGKMVRVAKGELPVPEELQPIIFSVILQIDKLGKKMRAEDFLGPISQALDKVTFQEWIKDQITAIVRDNTPAATAAAKAGKPYTAEAEAEAIAFAIDLFNMLCACIIGADTDEMSALYMLRGMEYATGFNNMIGSEKDGGQYLRPYGGSISYVNGLASELKPNTVVLSQPVTTITQHAHHVVVTTSPAHSSSLSPSSTSSAFNATTEEQHDLLQSSKAKHYRARKVIVSVPTALYRHITFHPPLPPGKHRIAAGATMGYYTKIIYVYDKPWWRRSFTVLSKTKSSSRGAGTENEEEAGIAKTDHVQLVGQTASVNGPVLLTVDTSIDETEQWSITAFLCGEKGRAWSRTEGGWEARREIATNHIRKLLASTGSESESGSEAGSRIEDWDMPEPLAVHEREWAGQKWFEGAPSAIYSLGTMIPHGSKADESTRAHKDVVVEPFQHLHFIGTETSDVWEGYMEGAVRSGERGAEEVVGLLKQTCF